MIDALAQQIEKNWSAHGLTEPYTRDHLSFTKFCQRVVGRHTKVLFLATYRGTPLCIIKTVRFPEFNQNLEREARNQASAPRTEHLSAPRVLWEGQVDGRAVYAEEYIDALPVTIAAYRSLAPHIEEFTKRMPRRGRIRSDEFVNRIAHLLPDDPVLRRHTAALTELKAELELGAAHGDLGRQNILGTKERAWIIDWERSGDIPFPEFDSADYALKSGRIVTPELFALRHLYTALYARFRSEYVQVAEIGRSMVA